MKSAAARPGDVQMKSGAALLVAANAETIRRAASEITFLLERAAALTYAPSDNDLLPLRRFPDLVAAVPGSESDRDSSASSRQSTKFEKLMQEAAAVPAWQQLVPLLGSAAQLLKACFNTRQYIVRLMMLIYNAAMHIDEDSGETDEEFEGLRMYHVAQLMLRHDCALMPTGDDIAPYATMQEGSSLITVQTGAD